MASFSLFSLFFLSSLLSLIILVSARSRGGFRRRLGIHPDINGINDPIIANDCVSAYPNYCLFVDPLPIPASINGSTGETIHLGAYIINQQLHRDIPATKLYGYGTSKKTATTPGPVIKAERGIPTKIQWANYITDEEYFLPAVLFQAKFARAKDGGIPIVMHLHGGETEPASDGHPDAWFTAKGETGPTYKKSLYTYLNTQPPATLWYHDHTKGLTRLSIYMGLIGQYHIHDSHGEDFQKDLPTGDYDIPLVFTNQVVNYTGQLFWSDYTTHNSDYQEFVAINGKAFPYLNVDRTKYRFRFLDSCNLLQVSFRFLYVEKPDLSAIGSNSTAVPDGEFLNFTQISTDGGYLQTPVELAEVMISPGERMDIIFDFGVKVKAGGTIFLINDDNSNLSLLMAFHVGDKFVNSVPVPSILTNISLIEIPPVITERDLQIVAQFLDLPANETFEVEGLPTSVGGIRTTVDNLIFDDPATEIVTVGDTEIWNIINFSASEHTIHLHAVKFRILSRQAFDLESYIAGTCGLKSGTTQCYTENVRPPLPNENGWKDTALVNSMAVLRILVRFLPVDGGVFPFDPSHSPGYVWHCHMHDHEDYEMMRPLLFVQRTAAY